MQISAEHVRSYFDLRQIKIVVVCGASGAGKSTFIDSVRDNKNIFIPRRVTTRDTRSADTDLENTFTSEGKFNKLTQLSQIYFPWARDIKSQVTKYGFSEFSLKQPIALLSANNAFVARYNNFIKSKNILCIEVFASKKARTSRLQLRSPELFQKSKRAELQSRLDCQYQNDVNLTKRVRITNEGNQLESILDFKGVLNTIYPNLFHNTVT